MNIHRPSPAYPTLPSPASTNLNNPPDLLMSTPTHHKAPGNPQPYASPFPSSPSPLPPTTTTSPPSTTNLTILPCTPSSLPYLLPLLTTTIPLNPFTALMLKQPHNTNPTAYQTLATWLYTAALHDPRAKIIALVAVQSEENQPPNHTNTEQQQPSAPVTATTRTTTTTTEKKPQQMKLKLKPHARIIGIAWLQHFLPNEEWLPRYPIPLSKHKHKHKHPIPPIIDPKAYARALQLLYTHRESCVGGEGGWYIRNIAADPRRGSQDVVCGHLLEYVSEMFAGGGGDGGEAVFWQAPPFRAAGGLYERMGWRWGMLGERVVEGAGEGLDWVGWVCRGGGEGD